ncbi:MAG: DNA cytosine methyltransferase [Egibacteraceae bacterium]
MARSLELFAGGGGMALGTHLAGFDHELLVEWEEKACATLRVNGGTPEWPWDADRVLRADVRDHVRELADDPQGLDDIDLLAGGPPCQPFSLGGEHRGATDERNMFPAALDYVRALAPKTVIFENVPGLLRGSFLPYFEYIEDQLRWPTVRRRRNEWWGEHAARLRKSRRASRVSLSYEVHRQVINAADLGAPQSRKRVFLVGVRSDIAERNAWWPVPVTHSRATLISAQAEGSYWEEHELEHPRHCVTPLPLGEFNALQRWRTVRDMLAGLPEPVEGREAPGVTNHVGIPGAKAYPGHTGSRMDWPAKTFKAGVHGVCGGEAMIRFPDDRLRYMTVRESARGMGFPDWFRFLHARSHAMRHIGNAVVVPVARAVGEHLLKLYHL